jgi:hypothetical protein
MGSFLDIRANMEDRKLLSNHATNAIIMVSSIPAIAMTVVYAAWTRGPGYPWEFQTLQEKRVRVPEIDSIPM